MINYLVFKMATLAAILFVEASPWVTEVETYKIVQGPVHSKYVYTHPANESRDNYCHIQSVTEEVDADGTVWTVYHCGAKTVE